MYRLFLNSTDDGVFSTERLVRFLNAEGDEITALVDEGSVQRMGDEFWLEVRAMVEDDTALVVMPTDGSRIRVMADRLEPLEQ